LGSRGRDALEARASFGDPLEDAAHARLTPSEPQRPPRESNLSGVVSLFFLVAGCLVLAYAIWLTVVGPDQCREVQQEGGDCDGLGAFIIVVGGLGVVLLFVAGLIYAIFDPDRRRGKR
jgi:hypothetical protein